MFVSILINNYNYGCFLREAIESALAQTYRHVEVVVVDDGSTDNSRSIIASYGDRLVSVLQVNGGQSAAFNAGFAASRGEVICFLDADDEFLPLKVQRIVDQHLAGRDTWYFHQMQFVDEHSNVLSGSPVIRRSTGLYDLTSDSLRGKSTFWAPATSGLSFSRLLLERLLPMPENIRITSDNYLKFAATALVPGIFIAETLSLQRIHGRNAYTFNNDPFLRAETKLLTGKAISQRHPGLRKIGDRLVASGLGGKYRAGTGWREVWHELTEYTSVLPVAARSTVFARFFYSAFFKPEANSSSPATSNLARSNNGLRHKVAAASRRS
jgi:glycosyltransferase involved in cell wall biosynthesis